MDQILNNVSLLNNLLVGSAFIVTVFVPVGLYLFKQVNEDDQGLIIREKIFKDIFVLKLFLWAIIFISILPIFIWVTFQRIGVPTLVIWAMGWIYIFIVTLNTLRWIISDNKEKIEELLRFLPGVDAAEAWESFWSLGYLGSQDKVKSFEILKEKINKLLKEKDKVVLEKTARLLGALRGSIDKFSTFFISASDNFLPTILEWHHAVWPEEEKHLRSGDSSSTTLWIEYSQIFDHLNEITNLSLKKSLGEQYSFSFFNRLREHFQKYENEQANSHLYLKQFTFYKLAFEKISDSPNRYQVWQHYFPEEWRVTLENFKKHTSTRIWFEEFLQWARPRIQDIKEKSDLKLDEVSRKLFPGFDPVWWSIILTFLIRQLGEGRRMRDLIEVPRGFGFGGRIFSFSASGNLPGEEFEKRMEEKRKVQEKEEREATIEFTCTVFRSSLSDINQYIEDLRSLDGKYNVEEEEEKYYEYQRKKILGVFTELKKCLNKKS